jgi:hypothetical protein
LEGKLITFLKTSEEAPCVPDDACQWHYREPEAILEDRWLEFDTAALQWQLTITGYGFSGTPELYVGGVQQDLVYLCTTKMVFAITDSPSETLTGMYMYFDDGYPDHHDVITTDSDDLVMTPELV